MSNFCPVGFKLLSASEFGSPAGMQVISLLIKWRRLTFHEEKKLAPAHYYAYSGAADSNRFFDLC